MMKPPLWQNSVCFKEASASKRQEIDEIDGQLSAEGEDRNCQHSTGEETDFAEGNWHELTGL